MDALREIAERPECLVDDALQLRHHCVRACRIATAEGARDAQLHHERDEILLRAIVDVALDASALGILRVHDPSPRRRESPSAWIEIASRLPASSAVSRTLRKTRPACDAKSSRSLSLRGRERTLAATPSP